jgi:predicted GIY-YIG superfamily endonuclease
MAVSRALRRLLRIRELEEEQNRLALESAVGELNRLEHALTASVERQRRGRSLVQSSAQTGQVMDRIAGFEETRSAKLHAVALELRIEAKEEDVTARREEFLMKRVERRQAETLIQENEAREAIEDGRHGQQLLDDWYSTRQYREGAEAEPSTLARAEFASQATGASGPAAK